MYNTPLQATASFWWAGDDKAIVPSRISIVILILIFCDISHIKINYLARYYITIFTEIKIKLVNNFLKLIIVILIKFKLNQNV